MSDTHQDEVVDVHEDDVERERREARERAYQDVSLRAVELLANAQRAADEAVAEAQSYARDLEETAREQYRVILQRANEAARSTAVVSRPRRRGRRETAPTGRMPCRPPTRPRPPRPSSSTTCAPTPGSRTRSSGPSWVPSTTSSTSWPSWRRPVTSLLRRGRRPHDHGAARTPAGPPMQTLDLDGHEARSRRTGIRRADGRRAARGGAAAVARATVVVFGDAKAYERFMGAGACSSRPASSTRSGCRSRAGCSTLAAAPAT